MMSHMRLWSAALIITIVIVGGFMLSVPRARELNDAPAPSAASEPPVVAFSDTYRNDVHTLAGSTLAPDACTSVSAEATLVGSADASSTGAHILLDVAIPEDAGVCLALPTKAAFSTTLEAPAGLPVEVRVNGVAASTTSAS